MTNNTTRLIATLFAAVFTASMAWSAPIPKQKPANQEKTELKFLKLEGVNPKTGAFTRSIQVTVTKYVQQTRTRQVVRIVNGQPVKEAVPYTVTVPVQATVTREVGTKTYDVYDGTGELIPAEKVFERIKEGQVVLISSTPMVPEKYLKVLAPETIIIAPKRNEKSKEE